ncbi:phospholipid-translocating P-type ATPase [Ramicandelaber brevisporus]|nr:phospholipid-translocating P-type ATPase [Ramicandelaber brevisporus]
MHSAVELGSVPAVSGSSGGDGGGKNARTIYLGAGTNARYRAKTKYAPNVVRNQKYNLVTFLPLVLYEQFRFFFNLYFLAVALSQFIPVLKIGYLVTYIGPLIFVLAITIGQEAYDDLKRKKRDDEANSALYGVLDASGSIRQVPSSKIKVGDFVKIKKDERIPADMILLKTSEQNGACFIRTDQLDGETDWKLRIAVQPTQRLIDDRQLIELNGSLYAEEPHKDIYNFIGNLSIVSPVTGNESTTALNVENTLWANTVLASGEAIGIVIYTGRDTRAVMNTSHPSTKIGKLDWEVNRLSKILFVVTLLMSFFMVALNGFRGVWYIYMFRFLILFSSIIPLSLRVNLDMGKVFYAWQIHRDADIPGTVVRTSSLPEELGRLEYLLSDKTGTLTKNEMELKKLHLGTISYTQDTMDDVTINLRDAFSSYVNMGGFAVPNKGRRDLTGRIADLIEALALCHNVTPVEPDALVASTPKVTYQASSPDEVAIVKFTESVGLQLVFRDLDVIHIKATCLNSQPVFEYEILHVFPFTSESKRMGIILKNRLNNEIVFYQKGADVVMSKIVQYNDWLDEECGNMARQGLRTLVIARKRLSLELYNEFDTMYSQAKVSMSNRQANMDQVISNYLEHDLELLGLTGVEDKLQDNVKPTLEKLRNAGLKIWMLTGDKVETATCIAVSSKLVSRTQQIHQISKLKTINEANVALDQLQRLGDNTCLVIDGESLQLFIDNYKNEFIRLAVKLPCVVACRCSPTQKADVAKLIKNYTKKRVCCIGDGGNDVSMIQAADLGIGIVGKEGKQASLAADISVTQFSHITKLMLWHGRNSYKRSAKLAQFVFHRGLIISIMQAVFSAMFYFAPIALYQGLLMVGYATVYTMAPVFSLVLDCDVTEKIAMEYEQLYKELLKGRSLSFRTFTTWLLISIYQGAAIMLVAVWLFDAQFIHVVSISFSALIFNELLMVAFEINTWHRLIVIAEVSSLLLYILSMYVLREYFDLSFILQISFVWKVIAITAISSLPLFIVKFLRRKFAPPIHVRLVAPQS